MARFDLPSPATKTILASAARALAQAYTSDAQDNHEADGVLITLVVTAVTATPALTLKVQYSPDRGTNWIDYFTVAAAVATAVNSSYLIYPGIVAAADGNLTESVNLPLPRYWRVAVTHGDTDSATYAVYAMYL
jgi:hypothetical protein